MSYFSDLDFKGNKYTLRKGKVKKKKKKRPQELIQSDPQQVLKLKGKHRQL